LGGFPTRADIDPSPNPRAAARIEKPSPLLPFLSQNLEVRIGDETSRSIVLTPFAAIA
jgi:hypothetical protein